MTSEDQEKPKSFFSETLLIAAITACAYLITFSYEAGFLNVFGIPLDFANLSLIYVFVVGSILLAVLVIIFYIVNTVVIFMPSFEKNHPISTVLKKILPFYILTLISVVLFGNLWKEWIWILVIAVIYTLIEIVPPLFGSRKYGYWNRMKKWQQPGTKSIFNFILPKPKKSNRKFIISILNIILIMVFIVFTAYYGGRARAIKENEFLILKSSPEMIAIKFSGDKVFLFPFDRMSHVIYKEYKIVDIEKLSSTFKKEELGRMQIK